MLERHDMEDKLEHDEAPYVDFSMQFSLAKHEEKVEQTIFEILVSLAASVAASDIRPLGAIVVLGDFEKQPKVSGMVQMKPKQNPIESLRTVDSDSAAHWIREFSEPPYDGAVVVDRSGQIVGAGVYLVIDNPTLATPDDCGTRHKAAASFSLRNDVISVLTISEETNTVRVWKDGKLKNVFRVEEQESKEEE